jgi:hypothetical protein
MRAGRHSHAERDQPDKDSAISISVVRKLSPRKPRTRRLQCRVGADLTWLTIMDVEPAYHADLWVLGS